MQESLSISETNKIRKSLGLSLLEEPEECKEGLKKPEHKEELKKSKLVLTDQDATTLVEEEEEEEVLDTQTWLKRFAAGKPQAKQQTAPKIGKIKKYTREELSGLTVGHDAKDLGQLEKDGILILQDQSVLEESNEKEVLISSELVEREQAALQKKSKRGQSRYQQYEENQGILSKYDEDQQTRGSFVLGNKDIAIEPESTEETGVSAEEPPITPMSSDYLDSKPVKFKKRKAQSKVKRSRHVDSDDEVKTEVKDDDQEDDDGDYLGSMLSRKRQETHNKRRKILSPEEIAAQVKEQQQPQEEVSSTVDFVTSIRQMRSATPERELDEKGSEKARQEGREAREAREEANEKARQESNDKKKVSVTARDFALAEQSLSGGMAATLRLLENRGVIRTKTAEELEKEEARKKQRDWQRQLEKERLERELRYIELKEEEAKSGSLNRLSRKEREELAALENENRGLDEARLAKRMFANYKPEVKIEYKDAEGNVLSTKEAYKYLSHQFHGNASGHRKIEKREQRLQEELNKERRPIFDRGS